MMMYVVKDTEQESFSNITAISIVSSLEVLVREMGDCLTSKDGANSWLLKFPDKMGIYQLGDMDDAGTVIGGEAKLVLTVKQLLEKFKEVYKERYEANVKEIKENSKNVK